MVIDNSSRVDLDAEVLASMSSWYLKVVMAACDMVVLHKESRPGCVLEVGAAVRGAPPP